MAVFHFVNNFTVSAMCCHWLRLEAGCACMETTGSSESWQLLEYFQHSVLSPEWSLVVEFNVPLRGYSLSCSGFVWDPSCCWVQENSIFCDTGDSWQRPTMPLWPIYFWKICLLIPETFTMAIMVLFSNIDFLYLSFPSSLPHFHFLAVLRFDMPPEF